MKKKSVLVICTLTLGVGGLGVVSFKGLGQGRPGTVQSEPLTKKQALIVPSRNASSATSPESKGLLLEAASQNATLKSGAEWLFGGKQQHGWYLYTPLIAKLIGTDKDVTTPDFAFRLAVNSPHFTGRALDLYVGGDPVDTGDANRAVQVNTPVYKWLVKNADKFGFYPYYYEPWHWEYKPEP